MASLCFSSQRLGIRLCLAALPCIVLPSLAEPARSTIRPEVSIRVQTFARERTVIKNPSHWTQYLYRVPEGTRVKEGDLLFLFDMSHTKERQLDHLKNLDTTVYRVRKAKASSAQEIENLRDELARVMDDTGVTQAKLDFQKSLPHPEDIRIAKGRLNVAQRNFEAAETELVRAKERHEGGLLSPAALARAERDLKRKDSLRKFASDNLEYAELPATTRTIRILELQLANLQLEKDKLENELEKKLRIVEIDAVGSDAELNMRQKRVDDIADDLAKERYLSPTNGVVMYTSIMKRNLASGSKSSKNTALIEIADETSVALRGSLPERERAWFNPGDPVEIKLNSLPGETFQGTVDNIRALPRDAAETGRSLWGEAAKTTGVKLYDIEISLEQGDRTIPLGVYGTATIRSATPLQRNVIPLRDVRMQDGKATLDRNGTAIEVKGRVDGHLFILDESGEAPKQNQPDETEAVISEPTNGIALTGELAPAESIGVYVPQVRYWDMKLTWIADEDSFVKMGSPIATLSSESLDKRLESIDSELQRAQSKRQSEEENLAIVKREAEFELTKNRNLLEIRKLEWEIIERGISVSALFQAQLGLRGAKLDLEEASYELARIQKPGVTVSDLEKTRRRRDRKRRKLQLRNAELSLEQAELGADNIERGKAKLAYLKQNVELAKLEQEYNRKINSAESSLRSARVEEQRNTDERNKHARWAEALKVLAPADGRVKYEKLWDGISVSKIKVGSSAWSGTRILSLSDSSQVAVQVDVPEALFSHLEPGKRVEVRIPGLTQERLDGHIEHIQTVLIPDEPSTVRAGLYANHEPSKRQNVRVRIAVSAPEGVQLTAGAIAHVLFMEEAP